MNDRNNACIIVKLNKDTAKYSLKVAIPFVWKPFLITIEMFLSLNFHFQTLHSLSIDVEGFEPDILFFFNSNHWQLLVTRQV